MLTVGSFGFILFAALVAGLWRVTRCHAAGS